MPDQQWTFPRWGCLVIAGLCLILLVWLPMRLLGGMSQAEVGRVPSPDNALDAVLVETNGGATTSFGYRIYLVPAAEAAGGAEAAFLYGARRSDCAFGVSLRWTNSRQLVVEYLGAQRAEVGQAEVGESAVSVQLKAGINDPTAPCGGMEYNLRGRPYG